MDAYHVKTVDTTGAGDAFIGALLCKIVDDQSVLEVSIITTASVLYQPILLLNSCLCHRLHIFSFCCLYIIIISIQGITTEINLNWTNFELSINYAVASNKKNYSTSNTWYIALGPCVCVYARVFNVEN